MTETELKQIHKNNLKLAELSEKHQLLKYDYGIGSKEITGMPYVGRVWDTSMNGVEEATDIEVEYNELLCGNERLIRKARRYIDSFPDWQLRLILTLRYVNGMPIYEIAPAIGVTEKVCETILMVHFANVF